MPYPIVLKRNLKHPCLVYPLIILIIVVLIFKKFNANCCSRVARFKEPIKINLIYILLGYGSGINLKFISSNKKQLAQENA